MSFESKAKTTPEVLQKWELGLVPKEQKWVKLEDAQKLEEEYADLSESSTELFKSEQHYQSKSSKLEEQITEANKILDEFCRPCKKDDWRERLRAALTQK